MTENRIENLCVSKGMRMTNQRRVIARVLSDSEDHPSVPDVHRRAVKIDSSISLATVYRTLRLLDESGILGRHDFRDGFSRFEEVTGNHHDHLVNIEDGTTTEFNNKEIEALQERIAQEHGLRSIDHRLELHGIPANYG